MRYFSHEELHRVIEANLELKEISYKVHSLPKARNCEEFLYQKLLMLDIYAEAIGCNCAEEAQERIKEIVAHFRQYGESLEELRESTTFTQCLEFSKGQEKTWAEQRKCYAPNANSYACYCDPK